MEKKNKKKDIKKIFIWIAIIAVVAVSAYLIKMQRDKPGQYDAFAKCLTEKGAHMYGTEWCVHCQNQKNLFGKSFQYVGFTDCDLDAPTCLKNNITGYPTWIINATQYQGGQTLARLGSLTECSQYLVQQ